MARPTFVLLAFVAFPIFSSTAGLVWKSTVVRAGYTSGQEKIAARFPFKNEGPDEADIASIRPPCNCVTVQTGKMHYQPGEKGVLIAVFTVGDHTGLQRKVIEVFEKGKKVPTLLTFEIRLPAAIQLSAQSLAWKSNKIQEPREFTATPLQGVHIDEIVATNSAFTVKSSPAKTGALAVAVRVTATGKPQTGLLRIKYSGRASGTVTVPLEADK